MNAFFYPLKQGFYFAEIQGGKVTAYMSMRTRTAGGRPVSERKLKQGGGHSRRISGRLDRNHITPDSDKKEGRSRLDCPERPERRRLPTLPLAQFRGCGTKIILMVLRKWVTTNRKRAKD